MKRLCFTSLFCLTWVGVFFCFAPQNAIQADSEKTPPASKENVDHARKTAKMLDEIYKTTIVMVTDKYVNSEEDFAAGSAAVLLFKQISEAGSHQVRLLDATGDPYEEKNVAQDEFEKDGIKALKDGAAEYEQVVQQDGKNVLRIMTPVPVVLEKCTMCHEHYKQVKPGDPIGAISYTIPIR